MSKHVDIKNQMKEAMLAKDTVRVGVLRGLIAAFTNECVVLKRKPDAELSDEEVLTVIQRQAKQRKDSIEQFEKGGRPELAADEKAELTILEEYLPAQMNREEIVEAVKAKMTELGISTKADQNKLIGPLMKDLKGRADGKVVQEVVSALLS